MEAFVTPTSAAHRFGTAAKRGRRTIACAATNAAPEERYAARGVSAAKEDIHNAIRNVDKGLFPQAFCKVVPDFVGGDEEFCNIMHADGAGTKSSLAYMYWKETGDLSVWKGIAQDAIVMNIDDLLCVGATDNILLSSTIGRNKRLVPGEVISAIINGTEEVLQTLRDHGISILSTGGETADLGDLVRTVVVDSTVTCRMKRSQVISNHNIRPGQVIVGLASDGKATYEDEYNGGTGSNGLTSARHDVFDKVYAKKYPESFDNDTPSDLVYSGSRKLTDRIDGCQLDVGKLVLSPTRTYAPVVKRIFEDLRGWKIHPQISESSTDFLRSISAWCFCRGDWWHGSLLRWRTDENLEFLVARSPRREGQHVSRTSPL
mmetsp:Transcript_5844/g.17507  ORF Transcript_5844/g.17507 Transcript_5844/m.17507 type:complete len:375 (-) Transcript_5844:1607-2731(-)